MKSQFSSLEEAIKQNSNYYMFLKKKHIHISSTKQALVRNDRCFF
jgi:hypothetical protein